MSVQVIPLSPEPPITIASSEVVSRLADELAAAAVIAEDCQEALGEALAGVFGENLHRDLAQRLQRLDELTQRIADLAGIVERLAESGLAGATPLDLFDALKLSDLRARLTGARSETVTAGEPELW